MKRDGRAPAGAHTTAERKRRKLMVREIKLALALTAIVAVFVCNPQLTP